MNRKLEKDSTHRDEFYKENQRFTEESGSDQAWLTRDPRMLHIRHLAAKLAQVDVPVLITGWIWFISLSLLIGHLFLALSSDRADNELKKAVKFAPTYMLWKVRVYLQTLVKGREKEWIRTTRR